MTYYNPHKGVAAEIKAGTYTHSAALTSTKEKLVKILKYLPSRKHAEVFVSALQDAKQNLQEQNIQNPTINDVILEVIDVLENWIEADNYRYADPTDNHKKGKFEDETSDLLRFLQDWFSSLKVAA